MADERMTFVLEGRDRLSRTLRGAGDSARRLRRDLDSVGDSSRSLDRVERSARDTAKGFGDLRSVLMTLAPAAAPLAASLVPIAAQAGAAGVAMAAFGAAVVPQVTAMSDAAKAQTKYTDAVRQHGKGSQQAAQAENEYLHMVSQMPPATRKASAALSVLQDTFKKWSNDLASSTMPAFTDGMLTLSAVLPKLSGVARGAGTQLQRLTAVVGGAVASPGFDKLMGKFTTFTNGVVKHATDQVIHFMRVLSSGGASSGISKFMDYARSVGPQVAETLKNLARAVGNVLQGASQAGGGILTLVNALAKMVAALPPGFITVVLQAVTAMKLFKLASAGVVAARAAMVSMTASAMTGAERVRGLGAAFMAMGRTAKLAVAASGIGLLVIALGSLISKGKQAPDVDRLTTSLGKLGQSGKVAGEAARAFGRDLGGLGTALRTLARPSNLDSVQQFLTSLIGMDSTPVKEAKEALDGADKALANLVKSGNADLAQAAFDKMAAAMRKQGLSSGELRAKLDDYRSALADQAFEQQLAAQSMGLFGQQAQVVQQKLAAQKQSADGLRQSIQALNDVQRQGLGGMIGFEASIDAATKAAKENAGALKMSHGELNLNSEKARNAATALQDLASKTDEAAGSARESGKSWQTVNGIYARGRQQLIANAMQMGLNRDQAKKLADQILKTPDKTAKLKGDMADLQAKIKKGKHDLANVPDSRKAKIRADIKDAESKLARIRAELAALRDKKLTVTTVFKTVRAAGGSNQAAKNYYETNRAHGGPVPGYASGGHVQALTAGGYVRGPGTGTSDSILGLFSRGAARVSDREYVVQAAAVRKYGLGFMEAINGMRLNPRPAGLREYKAHPAGDAGRQPLIGSLTVNAGANASAEDIIGEAMYRARVARRGGVFA